MLTEQAEKNCEVTDQDLETHLDLFYIFHELRCLESFKIQPAEFWTSTEWQQSKGVAFRLDHWWQIQGQFSVIHYWQFVNNGDENE